MSNLHFPPDHTPLILAVDTSSIHASFAITRGSEVIASIQSDAVPPHSKIFFDLLSSLLHSAHLQLPEIDAFAAALGPGSFTGLRVGLAAIKGLSHALGKAAIGIGSLDAVALTANAIGKVLAVIEAGREEVYVGLRNIDEDGIVQALGNDTVGKLPNLIEYFDQQAKKEKMLIAGIGANEENFNNLRLNWQLASRTSITAEQVAIQAAKILRNQASFDLHPRYIRPSDAEIKKAN